MTRKQKPKEIYTFTRLLELVQQLRDREPVEYRNNLFSWQGTDKTIDGLNVQAERGSANSTVIFNFRHPGQCRNYCSLLGRVVDGQAYTQYVPHFSTSYYSKKLQRFLPWDLPDGCKVELRVRMVTLNADGSVAKDDPTGWFSGYRRDEGRGRDGYVVIRDSDGKALLGEQERENLGYVVRFPVQEALGIAPDSVSPREWFDSMVGPHWNSSRVRLLAIKAYKEALRIVGEHPHMKIALYPMAESKIEDKRGAVRIGKGLVKSHVLERDSDMEPIMYWMPELCLYWLEQSSNVYAPPEVKFIYVTIPPHGCRLLHMDCEKIPDAGKTFRHGKRTAPSAYQSATSRGAPLERVAYTFGPKTKGVGDTVNWGSSPELVKVKVCGEPSKAVKPEDAFNSIEENALMSCLPLC